MINNSVDINVFKRDLKLVKDVLDLTDLSRELQRRGAANEKVFLPSHVDVRITVSTVPWSRRLRQLLGRRWTRSSARYDDWRRLNDFQVSIASLKSMRCCTGSLYSFISVGVMWSRSGMRWMTRVGAFCTLCSRKMLDAEMSVRMLLQ